MPEARSYCSICTLSLHLAYVSCEVAGCTVDTISLTAGLVDPGNLSLALQACLEAVSAAASKV